MQTIVGAESYGFYFSLLSFTWILNFLLDIGITNFNNRDISRHRQLLDKYFQNIFTIKLLLGAGYFILALIGGIIWGYTTEQLTMLSILLGNMFVFSFTLYLRSNISALQLFKTDSIMSVVDRFLLVILSALLIWGNIFDEVTIYHYVYAQSISYLVAFFVALFIVLSHISNFRLRINRSYVIALLKQSFPFALLFLLMSSYKWFDSFILERLLPENGKYQTGIYAQSFRLLDGVSQYAFLYAGLLLPMFSKMLKRKEPIAKLTRLSASLLIVPSAILAIAAITYRHEIIVLFFDQDVSNSSTILGILMVSFIGISTSYIFGTLLTANGNLKELNRLAAVAVGLNIVLNLTLVPVLLAKGSALSNLITQLFMALSQAYFVTRILKLKIDYLLIFKACLIILVLFFTGRLLADVEWLWYVEFLLLIGLGATLSVLTSVISLKGLLQILKNED
jgi:O-antigen/teichoic acid export membrane protein